MDQENKVICKYENAWQIIKTKNGLIKQDLDDPNEPDMPVIEVYRLNPGEYESLSTEALAHIIQKKIIQKKRIEFDFCGELDDFSGYVFWAHEHKKKITVIVRDGILTDVRIPKDIDLEIEALQIDRDDSDYEKREEYERNLYEDDSMRSADVRNIDFE